MDTIHSRIKNRRQALGLSMEDVAKKVGVKSWQTIQQWENGATAPNRNRVPSVATALGVSQSWLLTGDEPSTALAVTDDLAPHRERRAKPHAVPAIAEVIRLMEATDAMGQAIALSHVQVALSAYSPQRKQAK